MHVVHGADRFFEGSICLAQMKLLILLSHVHCTASVLWSFAHTSILICSPIYRKRGSALGNLLKSHEWLLMLIELSKLIHYLAMLTWFLLPSYQCPRLQIERKLAILSRVGHLRGSGRVCISLLLFLVEQELNSALQMVMKMRLIVALRLNLRRLRVLVNCKVLILRWERKLLLEERLAFLICKGCLIREGVLMRKHLLPYFSRMRQQLVKLWRHRLRRLVGIILHLGLRK